MQTGTVLDGIWGWIGALPDWQGAAVVVAVTVAATLLLRVGGDLALERVTARIPGDVDDIVFGGVHGALYASVAIGGLYVGLTLFDVAAGDLAAVRAATLSLITVVWTVALIRTGRRVSAVVMEHSYVDRSVVPIFQNVWTALVAGVGAFLLFYYWNVDVTPLLASAGIAGVVAGLAAKDAIANFFGSLALYLDGTYRVGDYVVLESGERGRVEDISVRSTVIRTRDDVLVTVPNAVLNNAAIVNESTPRRKRRIRVPVGVAYGTEVDEVESILLAVAEATDNVVDRPRPKVRFRSFGDSALEFELLCWIPNPALRARVTHNLNVGIYEQFRERGVEIPFPQRDVTVSTADGTGPFAGADAGVSVGDPSRND